MNIKKIVIRNLLPHFVQFQNSSCFLIFYIASLIIIANFIANMSSSLGTRIATLQSADSTSLTFWKAAINQIGKDSHFTTAIEAIETSDRNKLSESMARHPDLKVFSLK